MYNIYPDSEIYVVVLFRIDLILVFLVVHQHFSLEVGLFRWQISRGKLKAFHVDSIVEQTVISLAFEIRLSRYDPDASP